MPRLLRPLIAAVLLAVLAITPATAQTPQASPVPNAYEGLVGGATRQYSTDPELVPADDPDAVLIISAHLFRFDSDANAAASWEHLSANATEPLLGGMEHGAESPEFEEEAIDDLGDRAQAVMVSATNDAEGITGHFRLLIVQDGEFLILVTAIAGNEDATHTADDIARFMTEHDPGTGESSFNEDGTSTGGIWDKFPTPDDDVATDLIITRDSQATMP